MGNNIVGLDLNIDQDYLAQAVQQTVMMGIAESLNGKNEIVSQIVKSVLNTKVDDTGKISSYRSENKYTLLEVYVKQMLTEEVKAEMKSMIEEKRPEIRKMIKKNLSNESVTEGFCKQFIGAITNAINAVYAPRITVDFDKVKEY